MTELIAGWTKVNVKGPFSPIRRKSLDTTSSMSIPRSYFFREKGTVFVCLFVFCFFKFFIYLFMAVLGLRFCARAFSSCGKWGPLFIAVREPLIIAASLVAEHRLQTRRLSNCGSRA